MMVEKVGEGFLVGWWVGGEWFDKEVCWMEGWVMGKWEWMGKRWYWVRDVWVKEGGEWVKCEWGRRLVEGERCWRWVVGKGWLKVKV
jgi:hypothetical protein